MKYILLILITIFSFDGYTQALDSIKSKTNLIITYKNSNGYVSIPEGSLIRVQVQKAIEESIIEGYFYVLDDKTIIINGSIIKLSKIVYIQISDEEHKKSGKATIHLGFGFIAAGVGLIAYSTKFSPNGWDGITRLGLQLGGSFLIVSSALPFFAGNKIKNGKKYREKRWLFSISTAN